MNIYLINEDGDTFCIRAKTMHSALTVCQNSYLEDQKEEKEREGKHFNFEVEKKFYHEQILQSCNFVAELRN